MSKCPALVGIALEKVIEINPFYNDLCIDSSWESVSKEPEPELKSFLIDHNTLSSQSRVTSLDENFFCFSKINSRHIK